MSQGGKRYDAMMVEEYTNAQGEGKSKWTKVGAAFTNRDGSIGVQLMAFPINGKVVLQVPLTAEEREAKFGSHGQATRQQTGTQGGQRRQQRGGGPQQGGFANYGGRQPPAAQQQPRHQAAAPVPEYPNDWDDVEGDDPDGGFGPAPAAGGGFADE